MQRSHIFMYVLLPKIINVIEILYTNLYIQVCTFNFFSYLNTYGLFSVAIWKLAFNSIQNFIEKLRSYNIKNIIAVMNRIWLRWYLHFKSNLLCVIIYLIFLLKTEIPTQSYIKEIDARKYNMHDSGFTSFSWFSWVNFNF